MKKQKFFLKIIFYAVVFFCAGYAHSLPVNQTELESVSASQGITFENYTGPHNIIESASSIRGIGTVMGSFLQEKEKEAVLTNGKKYSVIHAVDSTEKGKLDADIFIIENSATVDHIDNLRRIIAGYLVSAYEYSDRDADTLAVFITVYNAVYRGDIKTWQEKYKKIVTKNLSAEKSGLSLSYREWPGNTQIVIPLGEVSGGGLSTVDTSAISDKNVVASMKEEDGKNIEERKALMNIKEREAELATQKAVEAKKNEIASQKELEKEKTLLPELKKQAEIAEKQASEEPESEEKQLEAQKKQEQLAASEEKIETLQNEIENSALQAKNMQTKADKKTSEAVNERTDIAKDQQKIVNEAMQEVSGVFALKLSDASGMLSELVKINALTGQVVKASGIKQIHSRTFFSVGNNFLAVAGENRGNAAVKLVLIDRENMKIIAQSEPHVAENSVLVKADSVFLCIIQENEKSFVGKFDENLNLLCKSQIAVNSATPVTITADSVYVTDERGFMAGLSLADLAKQ